MGMVNKLLGSVVAVFVVLMGLPVAMAVYQGSFTQQEFDAWLLDPVVQGDLLPDGDGTRNLGSAGAKWAQLNISEGGLSNSTVVSADVKDGELTTSDMSASAGILRTQLAGNTRPVKSGLTVCSADAVNTTMCDYLADGTADDVEINAALAAITGEVRLSEGDFYVTASITPGSRDTLSGAGRATQIRVPSGHNADLHIIDVDYDWVTVKNLAINGNRAGQSSGFHNGIQIRSSAGNTKYVRIEGLWVFNIGPNNTESNGVYVANAPHDIVIANSFFYDGSDDCLDLNQAYNVSIVGNVCLNWLDNGLDSEGGDHWTVTGNVFSTIAGNGVEVEAEGVTGHSDFFAITGNTFYDTVVGVSFGRGRYSTVTGNAFELTTGDTGILLTEAGDVAEPSTYNTIVGNTFQAGSYGVREINASNYNLVSSNVFLNQSTAALSLSGANSIGVSNLGASPYP